jgi:hypothetical protein
MNTNKPIYTIEEFLNAIPGTYGIMNRIAKKIGCNRQTVREYFDKYPEIKEAILSEREGNLDKAEEIIFQDIDNNKNVESAKWLLNKLGKDRGYIGDQQKETVNNISIEYVNDWRNGD